MIKPFETLQFTDDYMFCKVLTQAPDITKRLLEIILGVKVGYIRFHCIRSRPCANKMCGSMQVTRGH